MQTSKCIYCLQEKNISEFNSEHVVSRFIGKYEDAYTLHESQVCKECNNEKKILSIEEYAMSLDWPGEQVNIRFLDENFRPIEM